MKTKKQLFEAKVREIVKEELIKEDVPNQDLDFLYRLLSSAGPKITKAIKNLDKTYQQDQRWQQISKAWNDMSFGFGEFYHKNKK